MTTLTEADVEVAALEWLEGLGWQVAHGPDIAPDAPGAEGAVGVKESKGKITVSAGHEMGFLEVMERRRYELELVKGAI